MWLIRFAPQTATSDSPSIQAAYLRYHILYETNSSKVISEPQRDTDSIKLGENPLLGEDSTALATSGNRLAPRHLAL